MFKAQTGEGCEEDTRVGSEGVNIVTSGHCRAVVCLPTTDNTAAYHGASQLYIEILRFFLLYSFYSCPMLLFKVLRNFFSGCIELELNNSKKYSDFTII